jgi:hypothetical protein
MSQVRLKGNFNPEYMRDMYQDMFPQMISEVLYTGKGLVLERRDLTAQNLSELTDEIMLHAQYTSQGDNEAYWDTIFTLLELINQHFKDKNT